MKKASDAIDRNTIAAVKEKVELKVAEILIDYYEDVYVEKQYSVNKVKGDYIEEKCPLGMINSGYEFTIQERKVTVLATDNNGLSKNLTGTLLDNGVIVWDETDNSKPEEETKKVDIKQPGKYEVIFNANDSVKWISSEVDYSKIVENSASCTLYTSDDLTNWETVTITEESDDVTSRSSTETRTNDVLKEVYKITNAKNTQYLKVNIEIKDISGENSAVDNIKVSYYKMEKVTVKPEIQNTGATLVGGTYIVETPADGETTATGTATVTQIFTTPNDNGKYVLSIPKVGNPSVTAQITNSDNSNQTLSGDEISKTEVGGNATVLITTTLNAGDGVATVEVSKVGTTLETMTDTKGSQNTEDSWETIETKETLYGNGGRGFWEKCFINDESVGKTGIIGISENKQILVEYQTSTDGTTWSDKFTDLELAENKNYLKILVNYQTKSGEEFGDTSNDKITVMLNDGYWTATFLDKDGTNLSNQRVYFKNSSKQGEITVPDSAPAKENMDFKGWLVDGVLVQPGASYTLTQDQNFVAEYLMGQAYNAAHPEKHIPTGFHYLTGTASTGYVITDDDTDDGEDNGNEFVWIPVASEEAYTKKLGTNNQYVKTGSTGSDTASSLGNDVSKAVEGDVLGVTEILGESVTSGLADRPEAEIVNSAGGFWVGRYEAGVASKAHSYIEGIENGSNTDYDKLNTYWDKQTITVKAGNEPVREITQSKSLEIANNWKSGVGENGAVAFQSGLITGTQWDVVCNFIGWSLADSDCTGWGNYRNVTSETYTGYHSNGYKSDWVSSTNVVKPNSGTNRWIFPTGKFVHSGYKKTTTVQKNIFDIAGNVWEWTTEKPQYNLDNCIVRGGGAAGDGTNGFASYRYGYRSAMTDTFCDLGFRIVLYVE